MQKIVANLWFNGNAEEAVKYYLSVFPDSKVLARINYPTSKEEGLEDFQIELAGKVLTIDFEIIGMRFTALNAGPEFKFNEAVSFVVMCKKQDEIDYYWKKLSHSPENEQCDWCKDKFGLSWQIIPESMDEIVLNPANYKTMMNQKKIIIAEYV